MSWFNEKFKENVDFQTKFDELKLKNETILKEFQIEQEKTRNSSENYENLISQLNQTIEELKKKLEKIDQEQQSKSLFKE